MPIGVTAGTVAAVATTAAAEVAVDVAAVGIAEGVAAGAAEGVAAGVGEGVAAGAAEGIGAGAIEGAAGEGALMGADGLLAGADGVAGAGGEGALTGAEGATSTAEAGSSNGLLSTENLAKQGITTGAQQIAKLAQPTASDSGALTQTAGVSPEMMGAGDHPTPINISSSSPANPSPSQGALNQLSQVAANPSASPDAKPTGSWSDDALDWVKRNKLLTAGILGGGVLAASTMGNKNAAMTPAQFQAGPGARPASFNQPLTPMTVSKAPTQPSIPNWYNYGKPNTGGEQSFFNGNRLPQAAARGGPIEDDGNDFHSPGALTQSHPHHVKGPGKGQDDEIPAMLSDGEYVMDAQTVSDLGDGSNDAGSDWLDEFRQRVAKHRGRDKVVPPKINPDSIADRLLKDAA